MKKIIFVCFAAFLFCGCTAPQTQEADVKPEASPIPAFEKEEREVLPLPEKEVFADAMAFVDSILADYEVVHITDLEEDFVDTHTIVKKEEEGYRFIFKRNAEPNPNKNTFTKGALENFFNTPNNYYAILIRFNNKGRDDIGFSISTRYGGATYGLYEGKYPSSADLSIPAYDPMIEKKGNDFIYESGEWAYVLMAVTDYGQTVCYSWAEDDVNDYSSMVLFGDFYSGDRYDERWWGNEKNRFYLWPGGGNLTISDFWIYSYKELKR